jgi:hypothetical protein
MFAGAAFGCVSTPTPSLTPTEVTRIADTKAQASGFNPRNYGHTPATFDTRTKAWWIRYYDPATKKPLFAIDIEDKTGKATFKNGKTVVKIVH